MKVVKFFLHSLILLVLFLSLASVSASELNSTGDISEDVLNESSSNFGSYNDFSDAITNSSSINLEKNYVYGGIDDDKYSTGILVNKDNFVINGNNHAVDGNNLSRAFNVTGKNVTINNLVIKNTVYWYGSAIITVSNLTLNNVTFINCAPPDYYNEGLFGAILTANSKLNIRNCRFIDTSGTDGASISSFNSIVNVYDSLFESNSDNIVKGQIYADGSIINIFNSIFTNTTSRYATAIFCEDKSSVSISKSRFKNLVANKTAGAIAVKNSDSLEIRYCEFENVTSEKNAGAIFVDSKNGDHVTTISRTKFTSCSSDFGGAILQLGGDLLMTYTNFTSNSARYDGGAIYASYVNTVYIDDSRFESNSALASYGGACYLDMATGVIMGCNFTNNTGALASTIYSYDTILSLMKNYFNNPSDVPSIYLVYGKLDGNYSNNFNNDSVSLNNTLSLIFHGSPNNFVVVNDTHSFDVYNKTFDLRNYGWVSPVKDQGFMGACWAFGTAAALESALMRYANKTYSLSVNNMQNSLLRYSKVGDITVEEGAFPFSGVSYLIDWLGIFPDEYDGYDELGKISPLLITDDDIHIQNAVIIPKRKNATDNYLIKEALIKYGAVAVSHRYDFDEKRYFNSSTSSQFYNGTEISNHRVCIVGWNDTYSRNNFLTDPGGDGAWIVKNSWGIDWGDEGYFYVSYYDTSFATDKESVAFSITNDSYNKIYQYDVGGSYNIGKAFSQYYNVFVAEEDELIAAVGTLFNESGMDYEFTIYINGTEVYFQKGVSKLSGYETIKLNKYIQIRKGDVFKIKFKNIMPYRSDLRIHHEKGHSFGLKGNNWEDLDGIGIVAILKAYTVSNLNITSSKKYYYDGSFIANVTAGDNVLFEINGTNITAVADDNGLAKLDLRYVPGNYVVTTTCGNISIVQCIVINTSITGQNLVRAYNSGCSYTLQLVDGNGTPLNDTSVEILINGVSKSFTCDSGYVTVEFAKLTKSQKIQVTNPLTGASKTFNIKVVSRFSGAGNVIMYYYDGSKFKAKIIGDDGNAVGANQKVTIKINKKSYTVKTNSKGYVTFKIPKTVKPGTYKLTATYKGQTIKKTVKVKQNLKTRKYAVKKSAKKLKVKATLKNGKKAVKGKWITLKVFGKKYKAKTGKKGIAKFTIKKNVIKKLKVGKKYRMKFTYLRNSIKTTVKVKR